MCSNQRTTLSILVDNNSGVLARVAGLFARRGYNIDSLTVSATNDPLLSRITVSVQGDRQILDQIIHQTEKLIETRAIAIMEPDESIQRELVLVKVAADDSNRSTIREVAEIYKAKIADLTVDSMIMELTGRPAKIDAFLNVVREYDILEMCRTGVTVLERGSSIMEPAPRLS